MTRFSAVIAFGAISLLAAPAAAETVFDNYTGTTGADLNATFIAAGFTPSADYNFTDASAFVHNQGPDPELFSIALYSSTASAGPDARLWTSGAVSAPAAAYTLVSASYNGSPITLQKDEEYFFVLELTNASFGGQVFWAEDGKTTVPTYHSRWKFMERVRCANRLAIPSLRRGSSGVLDLGDDADWLRRPRVCGISPGKGGPRNSRRLACQRQALRFVSPRALP